MLSEILAKAPLTSAFPDLIVGTESCDDAAVYRLNDTQALVATTDFFMPIVDDPYDFGRIAATNAISDVYAMGGKPMMALALLGMPVGKVSVETIQRIVAGGQAVCAGRRHSDRRRVTRSIRRSRSMGSSRSVSSIPIASSATTARKPATC